MLNDFQLLKARVSIIEVLQKCHPDELFTVGMKTKEMRIDCPQCRRDSLVVYLKTDTFYCHKCKEGRDIIDYVKFVFDLVSVQEAYKQILNWFPEPTDKPKSITSGTVENLSYSEAIDVLWAGATTERQKQALIVLQNISETYVPEDVLKGLGLLDKD